MRFCARLVVLLVAGAATATLVHAQQQTGEIFGRVTDQSGAVMPGVTVTVTGPVLLQPLTAVTSEAGTYQFPRLEIGGYTVRFELTGFKTVVSEDVRVTVGYSAQINAVLGVSTVEETITVTGQSPIVDTKETGTRQTFTNELLQNIPSARDPWVILQQTAGIAMDRENIGGNMSGQQSNYVSRGGMPFNNKWSLDGVDITDMAATGASPTYYDFDAFEEMTITTGGVDVTQQTGGVGVNLVTKSGTDRFRGSSRFYDTNHRLEGQNITDEQRAQGATSGNPIQDIQDYGVEAGGPIRRGRAWIWGSYGKQKVGVGVINFYQPTPACQAIKANPGSFPIEEVNDCLNTDLTTLQSTNVKAEVQIFKGNKATLFSGFSKKERNARNASDLTPPESTVRQSAVPDAYGPWGWKTGPGPTYKVADQWIVNDRLLLDVQYAHVGNNFILDYHDDSLRDVQPTLIISTGLNGRSTPDGAQSVNIRPVNEVNLHANTFLPGTALGDHAIKFGGYWKDAYTYSSTHTPGYAVARFPTSTSNDCSLASTGCQANVTRDGAGVFDLVNVAAYVQDTLTRDRLTLQLGLRYDRNHDQAFAATADANPLVPGWLPAIAFPGVDPGIVFNNVSPRLGLTYDLRGSGKTIARVNYASYWGQVGTGGVANQLNPISRVSVRYPWIDLNGDKFVQANEVVASNRPLAVTGNWDPNNPSAGTTANTVDPNLENDRTDEFIVGADHELAAGFGVGVNYIWRRYANFNWTDINGLTSADYTAVAFTPPAASCPSAQDARCPMVTYYQPNFQLPTVTTLTNAEGFTRSFNGVEITGRKRLSNRWLMNTSFSYNSTLVNFNQFTGSVTSTTATSSALVEDPTNRARRDGFQYDYPTTGSGIGNVYVNAKWLFKASGMYQAPYGLNLSAFYNARQGYPLEASVQSPSRPNGGGIATVLLDGVGDNRLPNYQNLDFHVDRPVFLGTARLVPALDIFNVMNGNTVQALQRTQNAATANQISAVLAPRVVRLGVKVTW
ncbi:MAG TPA: TonB-dependent receptor [Vicinamibacterales bacterium]|nr:TonB-dependent receptor [Vicinamibacterales bacterium]